MDEIKKQQKNKKLNPLFTTVALILCLLFGIMLLCNLIIIIKGVVTPDKPPSIFGITPMVVQSGSMSGSSQDHIEVGDLIFIKSAKTSELKEGDIISFLEKGIVVTHRIIKIETDENGKRAFITKGDANNTQDNLPVKSDNIVGLYASRIPKLGDFAMFLQKPLGMILFVGIPLFAFIVYDIIRRQRQATKEHLKTAEMEAEIERLRSLTEKPSD